MNWNGSIEEKKRNVCVGTLECSTTEISALHILILDPGFAYTHAIRKVVGKKIGKKINFLFRWIELGTFGFDISQPGHW